MGTLKPLLLLIFVVQSLAAAPAVPTPAYLDNVERLDDVETNALQIGKDDAAKKINDPYDDVMPSGPVIALSAEGKSSKDNYDDSDTDDKDDMEAAETIVFRPLFRYKKQQVQKKRVYQDAPSQPTPVANTDHRQPASVLIYDKNTGAYYPASAGYADSHSSYPAYFHSRQRN